MNFGVLIFAQVEELDFVGLLRAGIRAFVG
jgi:hypothetical protein